MKTSEKRKNRIRGRLFFLRILLWLVLAALIPVIILCVQGIVTSNRLNKEKNIAATEAMAANISSSFSLVLDNLGMQNSCIVNTKECTTFVGYKNGRALEEETAPYNNPQHTYEYLIAKKEFRSVLESYLAKNALLSSIYYCDASKDLIMSSMWLDSNFDSFFDIAWQENIDWNTMASPVFLPLRKVNIPNGDNCWVISVVYRSSILTTDVSLLYNLNANALFEKCVGKGQLTENDYLFLYDDDGQEILAYMHGRLTLSQQEETLSLIDDCYYGAEHKLANGWTVRLVRNLYSLNANQQIANRSILFVAVSVSIFTLVLLVLLVLQINKPISQWNRQMEGKQNTKRTSWLAKGTEVEAFGEWLTVSGTALRARFWTQAVMGRIENLENFKHVHFHIELKDFLVAVVSLDNSENARKADAEILACSAIAQLLRQSYKEYACDVVEMNDDNILVLINCTDNARNETSGRLIDIYRQTVQSIGNASDIAVGGFCNTLRDVQECYNRAQLLLHYQRITGNLQTQYNPLIETSLNNLMPRLWEKEKSLSFCIQHHDYEEAENILCVIRDEINSNISAMDYFQIRHRILHIATQMVDDFQQENGVTNLPLLTNKKDIYSQILQCDNLDKVWQMLISMLHDMEQSGDKEEVHSSKSPVGTILSMLESDCGKDMNLAQLSDRIGMSSVYISKAFKKAVGENYTQYLTRKRMEVAKTKLLNTDMRVQDIAESLGYSQSHYFSKVFKEHYGLSPREFVQQQTKNT